MAETCDATHVAPTASGNITVRCAKSAGHVDVGDKQHEGKIGTWPVRWAWPGVHGPQRYRCIRDGSRYSDSISIGIPRSAAVQHNASAPTATHPSSAIFVACFLNVRNTS